MEQPDATVRDALRRHRRAARGQRPGARRTRHQQLRGRLELYGTWSRPPPKPAAADEPQTEPAADEPQTEPAEGDHQPDTGDGDAKPASIPDAHQQPDERERRRDREASWGTPQHQPPRPQRDVLRLLPAGRHRCPRRARPRGAQSRPPHAPRLMPTRPARPDRARHRAHAHHRHQHLRSARRLRLLLPPAGNLRRCPSARSEPA